MKIDSHMVAKKVVAGKRANGNPVVMIVTHGGLYAFFAKNDAHEIETLGMAPHKGIAAWMAEKKVRDITWESDFNKHEQTELEDLKKSHESFAERFKKSLFSNVLVKSNNKLKDYLVYDSRSGSMGIMAKGEIQSLVDQKAIYEWSFVRNMSFNEPVQFLKDHIDFTWRL